jgi:hypothetical protein
MLTYLAAKPVQTNRAISVNYAAMLTIGMSLLWL